ncbi:hypothetical protein OUZ56_031167 [Daphnia magna]|uniref:Uncharacterized protein n=1 Tax=Daphnia magna TaxID=35525 RepID=A0ABQ9ZTG6_9CRUS|nr:hypothetical protein OUZ56_031167 [Daphnia magna]
MFKVYHNLQLPSQTPIHKAMAALLLQQGYKAMIIPGGPNSVYEVDDPLYGTAIFRLWPSSAGNLLRQTWKCIHKVPIQFTWRMPHYTTQQSLYAVFQCRSHFYHSNCFFQQYLTGGSVERKDVRDG